MGFIALALTLALAQPPLDPGAWSCRWTFRQAAGQLEVERVLGPYGAFVSHDVHWTPADPAARGSSAHWRIEDDSPWTLDSTGLVAEVALSRPTDRAIWAVLRVDGRIVSRNRLGSGRDLLRAAPGAPRISVAYWSGPRWPGRSRTGPVPALANAASATVTAEEEGGAVLGSVQLPMPNWTQGRRQIDAGRTALARTGADFRNRCTQATATPRR